MVDCMINPKTGRAIKVGGNVNKRIVKSEEVARKRIAKATEKALKEIAKIPKKRGRPAKPKPSGYNDPMLLKDVTPSTGKKRGRPKGSKNKPKTTAKPAKVKNMIVPKYLLKNS